MEAPHLWLIDRDGRSFIVNLRDNSWNEVSTPELKSRNCFKRISAVSSCAWAINANQQPCLYVHATQVPIRARVEVWENERWGLMNGWSVKSVRILKGRFSTECFPIYHVSSPLVLFLSPLVMLEKKDTILK